MIFIPEYVINIMNLLTQAEKHAYVVGGCVRDALIGRKGADFDVTCDATPDEVIKILSGIRVVETGIKHGTVTAITRDGNVEITTHRTDGAYTDNRHPDGVHFTSDVREDLARRDFTMNALAYNHTDGLIDIFGGTEDIKNCVIRCVGDPHKRFEEDALRILRAVRFGAVLGFSLEKNTAEAANNMCHLLSKISRERIFEELKKLVCGDFADETVNKYRCIIFSALGIADNGESFGKLKDAPAIADIRFALLLKRFSNVEKIVASLKCSRAFSESVISLVRDMDFSPKGIEDIVLFIAKFGIDYTEKLSIFKGDSDFSELLEKSKRECKCQSIKELDINGDDIIKNISLRNEQIGDALNELFSLVAKGTLKNRKDALLAYLKSKT